MKEIIQSQFIKKAVKFRKNSIDILSGLVMVILKLDHTHIVFYERPYFIRSKHISGL